MQSVYGRAADSVGGLCLRALRNLRNLRASREHMVYLSALFCCTLTDMDACYSQFSTSARPSFCRSRCPPTALCRRAVSAVCVYATDGLCLRDLRAPKREYPRKPRCIYTVSILYRDFQGLSGIFRDIWDVFQGHLQSFSGQ